MLRSIGMDFYTALLMRCFAKLKYVYCVKITIQHYISQKNQITTNIKTHGYIIIICDDITWQNNLN
jgi:hypothetical protein